MINLLIKHLEKEYKDHLVLLLKYKTECMGCPPKNMAVLERWPLQLNFH